MSELEIVLSYHERTKHRFDRYARSLGYMDWETQPNPFRRYEGASVHALDLAVDDEGPRYDALFDASWGEAEPLSKGAISALFYDSLALSAWKSSGPNRWSLRVNPSSGNLHPTEAYVVAGPIVGICEAPAIYHYAPFEHAFELRAELAPDTWNDLSVCQDALLVGLTSVVWREAWKYGERSFRYCQHDVGHAIGALSIAAAMQGRRCRVVETVDDSMLAQLLGIAKQFGPEREHPDVLLSIGPADGDLACCASLSGLDGVEFRGDPNALSPAHHAWPILDEVAKAVMRREVTNQAPHAASARSMRLPARDHRARTLVRTRRSAMEMDGQTCMDRQELYALLSRLLPPNPVLSSLGWPPQIHLMLFLHRVKGLDSGIYGLVRNPEHEASLRHELDNSFSWEKPPSCPGDLPLWLLMPSDVRELARTVSCHQDIASDGVFSVAMLARFLPALEQYGPWFYRRLFWEAGVIGQLLYLESEAAGVRGTGIGCFFDDAVHQRLGLEGRCYQSLYHFTVGGPIDDPRLRTLAAYGHLSPTTP